MIDDNVIANAQRLAQLLHVAVDASPLDAYRAGVSCQLVGATGWNCHFRWFTTPELCDAWQSGYCDQAAR